MTDNDTDLAIEISTYPYFSYTLKDKWTDAQRDILIGALLVVGMKLAPIMGLNPVDAYSQVFGNIKFSLSRNLGVPGHRLWGSATSDGILLDPRHMSINLILHELGHILALRCPGLLDELIASGMIRLSDGEAPDSGFRSSNRSHGFQMQWLPRGGDSDERFADIFMCWVLNIFADNDTGRKLYAWMDEHIREWLGKKGESEG
jgi:hypothetical protein